MDMYNKLFVFEMANNHQGSVEHGKTIIRELKALTAEFDFQFAVKLQYRNLETFIHPDYKNRQDIKYVKRFNETELKSDQLLELKQAIDENGFISICTPFDEESVSWIEQHGFKFLKIASCSLTDWPLLERIAETSLPLIASTAGAKLEEIQNAVVFFKHRHKTLALMHCVGEYPTPEDKLQLGQIGFLKRMFPEVPIGYSTHEAPDETEAVKMAISMGAQLFEKHVGVGELNGYSANPQQVKAWLQSAQQAYRMLGQTDERVEVTAEEIKTLNSLRRAVFASGTLNAGDNLSPDKYFLAIPSQSGQLLANDLSKYKQYRLNKTLEAHAPVMIDDLQISDIRPQVFNILRRVSAILRESKLAVPDGAKCELSHHYGIDAFEQSGATIISVINREYCKKLLILLPGQSHPIHRHQRKEETFNVLDGELLLTLDGIETTIGPGQMVTVERGVEHAFSSQGGVIFEELSTTHFNDDSFYADSSINSNLHRKTHLIFRSDWLKQDW
jgi:sialic acid synthase SpsE/mannose-6-phosphate isomerase-like protein (cupin superfamily)